MEINVRQGVWGSAHRAHAPTLLRMDVFLAMGSLVLFWAALVLALGGRPATGGRKGPFTSGGRRRDVTLVRGRDFFERGEGPGGN